MRSALCRPPTLLPDSCFPEANENTFRYVAIFKWYLLLYCCFFILLSFVEDFSQDPLTSFLDVGVSPHFIPCPLWMEAELSNFWEYEFWEVSGLLLLPASSLFLPNLSSVCFGPDLAGGFGLVFLGGLYWRGRPHNRQGEILSSVVEPVNYGPF